MIKEFLEYQRDVRGLSAKTLMEYEKELRVFASWGAREGLRWSTMTKQDVDRYTAWLTNSRLSVRTVKKRVSVVRCIYRWAEHEGLLDSNPAQWCQTPRIKEELPEIVDVEKVDNYLCKEPHSREDRVVHVATAIMLETGIRIGELCRIKYEDIDIDKRSIIISGKGGGQREVFYSDRTAYALENWTFGMTGLVFTHDTPESIRWAMYKTLGSYCPRVHPHQLRHTFATMMINRGMDIKTLGVILGHKHVETTEIYAKVNSKHTADMYNKFIF